MKTNIAYIVATLLLMSSVDVLYAQLRNLSLTDALALAKQGNKALQVQALEEIGAKEMSRETKGSLLPTISGSLAYAYYMERQVIFLPGSFAGTDKPVQDITFGGKHTYNGFVSLYQPLFAPANQELLKASQTNEKMEKERLEDLKSKVAHQVSTRYLNILLMKSQLGLLDQSFQRNVKALQDSRSLLAQGRGLKSDTLSSFIAVENLKSAISYLKNNVEVSGIELQRLIGVEDLGQLELTDKLELDREANEAEFYQLDKAFQLAETNRNDLHIQELAIDLQHNKLKATQAMLLPQLALIGQYQVQAQADNLKFGQYTVPRTSFLGLQLTVPIFNGHRTKSQISQAKIKTEQEGLRLRDLKDKIKTELATVITKWKEANTQLIIQETTVSSAEVNHRMMDDRFKNGLGTRLELTDAELALTQAKINYLNAVYNLRMLHVELRHALGLLTL